MRKGEVCGEEEPCEVRFQVCDFSQLNTADTKLDSLNSD
jgi:hypothetical protein